GTGLTERYTRNEGVDPLMITQNNKNTSTGFFGFLRSGVDIFLDNRNTLTVSGLYMNGKFKPTEYLKTQTDTLTGTSVFGSGIAIRNSDSKRDFKNRGASVAYKHLFPREGQEWTADVNFNSMTSDMNGDYKTQNYLSDMTENGSPALQNQQIEGDNTILTAQSDFVLPLGTKRKLETGIRGSMRDYSSVNQNFI